jgi:hypothetical protein
MLLALWKALVVAVYVVLLLALVAASIVLGAAVLVR